MQLYFYATLYLFLLFFILVYIFFVYKKSIKNFSPFFSDLKEVFSKNCLYFYLHHILLILVFCLFVIILFSAYGNIFINKSQKKGIDIILLLDSSLSMQSRDIKPSRFEKAKDLMLSFISNQDGNKIGFSVFSGEIFYSISPNFDYFLIKNLIKNVDLNHNYLLGSAIGNSILDTENRFDKDDREKLIIIFTDGNSNLGHSFEQILEYFKNKKIKIWSVGIGSDKKSIYHYSSGSFSYNLEIKPLNYNLLKKFSDSSFGKVYKYDNFLENVFTDISKLDKKYTDVEKNYGENDLKKFLTKILLVFYLLYLGFYIILKQR